MRLMQHLLAIAVTVLCETPVSQFIAGVTKLDIDIDPVLGADMDAVVRGIAGYDAAVVQRAQELGGP